MPYNRKYECDNCGVDGDLSIDFGVKAPESCFCPNCGVDGARVLPINRAIKSMIPPTLFKSHQTCEPITNLPQPIYIPEPYFPPGTIMSQAKDHAAIDIITQAKIESQTG